MTFSAPISSPTRSSPTGYAIEPVATIVPCPTISRGTEATVPIPPGLVSVMLPPVRSSAVSVLVRAFSTSALYASTNSAKLIRPASRITGTISVRPPSLLLDVDRQPEVHRCRRRRDGAWRRSRRSGGP